MGQRISIKQQRKDAPAWVFDWKQRQDPRLSKWIALLVVTGVFALLVSAVRIRVAPPVTWAAPKATVYHTTHNAEGRILTQRAREGGPFPSRFLPSEWEGAAILERSALGAARWTSRPHVPALRDLPDEAPPPLQLAPRGVPVLPKRQALTEVAPAPVALTLAPVIHPISGIHAGEIPRVLPPVETLGDAAITTKETWRFLLRLDATGHVRDCVSLTGGDESGRSPMEAWLRRVTFKTDPGKPSRWVAVGVGFVNQPASNGTDTP